MQRVRLLRNRGLFIISLSFARTIFLDLMAFYLSTVITFRFDSFGGGVDVGVVAPTGSFLCITGFRLGDRYDRMDCPLLPS